MKISSSWGFSLLFILEQSAGSLACTGEPLTLFKYFNSASCELESDEDAPRVEVEECVADGLTCCIYTGGDNGVKLCGTGTSANNTAGATYTHFSDVNCTVMEGPTVEIPEGGCGEKESDGYQVADPSSLCTGAFLDLFLCRDDSLSVGSCSADGKTCCTNLDGDKGVILCGTEDEDGNVGATSEHYSDTDCDMLDVMESIPNGGNCSEADDVYRVEKARYRPSGQQSLWPSGGFIILVPVSLSVIMNLL